MNNMVIIVGFLFILFSIYIMISRRKTVPRLWFDLFGI